MSPGAVVVTGAGGFIGSRITEVLHEAQLGPVRAGVRRWSTAAQVGRLPVDIVHCDVLNSQSLDTCFAGARAVVHCAIGDAEVNVTGTRNVLQAAKKAGVERVIHLSTIDVYGRHDGHYPETAPRLREGAAYGDSKIAAEEICEEFRAQGLPITILRPTIVYGPGSTLWTVEFADRLSAGAWLFSDDDTAGTCNLVYVDDVVGAVVKSLTRSMPDSGTYNVNGPEATTWSDYFRRLNDALGLPPLVQASRARSRLAAAAMQPIRSSAKLVLRQAPGLVKAVYQRSALARRIMKGAESAIRQTPTAGEFKLYSIRASFPIERARTQLDYRPAFSIEDGISLSVRWLRQHRTDLPRDGR
jgi:UDP-glucose 4-epimerase